MSRKLRIEYPGTMVEMKKAEEAIKTCCENGNLTEERI